jgi:hypothetical protein
MPPDVKDRAEAAERMVHFGKYVTVLTAIVLLLNGSSVSVDALGLTANNWKSAIGLGIIVGFIVLGLRTIMLRVVPLDKIRKEAQSHGPLGVWFALELLGSFTTQFWRAFCIITLISIDISEWVAVLIVAVIGGATYLSTSTARAAGFAINGVIAGLLFVKTGSLVALLSMSLIAAATELYRSRRILSET